MFDVSQWLFKPITVQQREVVLIPDVVGPIPVSEQHNYVEIAPASSLSPAIAVREQDVEDVREKYPHLPVYGIWQVLVHSGLVSSQRTLQVLQTSAWDGYYLFSDLGRIQYSGVYEAGFFAADTSFSLQDAQVLQFAESDLSVPEQPARLARELHSERRARVKHAWLSCALCVAVLAGLGFAVDVSLHFASHSRHEDYLLKSTLLQSAQQGLESLRTSRLLEVPDDRQTIARLAQLWSLDPQLRTEQPQSFAERTIRLQIRDLGSRPSAKYAWLSEQYDPRGHWILTIER